MSDSITRKTLFRWAGWFALANSVVFGLVSLRYLGSTGLPETALAWVYLVSVYIGHHVLLTIVPLFLVATPLILLLPRRRVVTVAAVVLFALMIALMMLDSLLWSQSRFHINALTMRILGWQSWVFAGVIFGIGLVFQAILARSVWNWVQARSARRGGRVAALAAMMIVLSQGIHAWADAAYYVPVTGLGHALPVYKGVTAKSLMTRMGLVDVAASRERELARRVARDLEGGSGRLLQYPLNPLQCSGGEGLNLVFIIADALRGAYRAGTLPVADVLAALARLADDPVRAVATAPEVLLMDEPCSALDPIATAIVAATMTFFLMLLNFVESPFTLSVARQRTARQSRQGEDEDGPNRGEDCSGCHYSVPPGDDFALPLISTRMGTRVLSLNPSTSTLVV